MTPFRARYGPWALVTGAAAGIGAEFARQLAARGLHLVLVARRADRLEALAASLHDAHGIDTQVVPLDLSEPGFLPTLQAQTRDLAVGLVVSSAGFSVTGELLERPLDRQLAMIGLNVGAPLQLAHAFGCPMKARGRGGLIFVSSIVGFVPTPLWTAYAATKAFNLFLGEGLSHELCRHGVDVLALCPGTTRTEFLEVAEIDGFLPMNAAPVVARALRALGRRRVLVPGWPNWLLTFLPRFLPRSLSAAVSGRIVRHMAVGPSPRCAP